MSLDQAKVQNQNVCEAEIESRKRVVSQTGVGMSYTALTTDLHSFIPVALCASRAIFTPLSRYSTTLTKSASLKLRDVKAGAPTKQRTE